MLDPMACLKDGVPLSLVIDLLEVEGPNAPRIYAEEPADVTWTLNLRSQDDPAAAAEQDS